MDLAKYRKGVVAVVGLIVTVALALGKPLPEGTNEAVLSIFDAICVGALIWIPNKNPVVSK